jgi:hypothetical protein
VVPLFCVAAPALGTPFLLEIVDDFGMTGFDTCIALDAGGVPCISYFRGAGVRYATKSSGVWTNELVEGGVGGYTSLAFDSDGAPHVSYRDDVGLRYATKASGSWMSETADGVGDVGYYTALVLHADDHPGICYFDQTNHALKYAFKLGGMWTVETVEGTGVTSTYNNLVLDDAGQPHVAFRAAGIRYGARSSGGTWSVETVDASGLGNVAIDLDAAGDPHVAYFRDGAIQYARKVSSFWETETVEGTTALAEVNYVRLTVGGPQVLQIVYRDGVAGDLMYARKRTGVWEVAPIDEGGEVGAYASMTTDSRGCPWISYRDATNSDLKLAGPDPMVVAAPERRPPSAGWTLFPNPARDHVRLAVDLSQDDELAITLVDVAGRVVARRGRQQLQEGRVLLGWDLRGVPSGVYFLEVAHVDGRRASRPLTLIR